MPDEIDSTHIVKLSPVDNDQSITWMPSLNLLATNSLPGQPNIFPNLRSGRLGYSVSTSKAMTSGVAFQNTGQLLNHNMNLTDQP